MSRLLGDSMVFARVRCGRPDGRGGASWEVGERYVGAEGTRLVERMAGRWSSSGMESSWAA